MITKKLTRCQACWAEFLLGFNFVISYTSGKENQKADSLTQCPNDLPSDDNDDCQQHLLETTLLTKRLEIISIEGEDNTIINRVVQANLEESYCSKLRYSLKADHPTKEIDSHHFSNLSVNSENCIH